MGELTTKKQNLPNKEAIGQYVHDMLDLEIRAHSLRKTAEETRTKAECEEKRATSSLVNAKAKKEEAFKNWQAECSKPKLNYATHCRNCMGKIIGAIIAMLFLFAILIGCIVTEEHIGFYIFMGILGLTFLGTVCCVQSSFDNALQSQVNRINDLRKIHENTEQKLAETQKKMEQNQIYVQKLRAHADQLDKDIAKIEKSLQHNYALNIVPPDYRRLECLLWIDYAFRNDQVDTMREATLQCDKWTRHGEQMQVLNELARNFRSIGELLETMNTNISMMNQDLFRIAEAQEKQLSETQSARYAMESVKQSTERLEFYEEMKRHGTF